MSIVSAKGLELLSALLTLLIFAVCHDSKIFQTQNFPSSIILALSKSIEWSVGQCMV